MASKREQDMARRAKAAPSDAGPSKRKLGLVVGAAAVVVALLVWAAWPGDAPNTRDEHFASFGLSDDPFLGSADAPIVLVGYESPHCSSCKGFHQTLLPDLKTQFIDSGNVVYHYIQGTISNDLQSNMAQECAFTHGGNDAFWSITNRFYERANTYSTPDLNGWLTDLAAEFQLDEGALLDCLRESESLGAVNQDWRAGDRWGARGTPTFWAFGPEGEAVQLNSRQVGAALEGMVAALP